MPILPLQIGQGPSIGEDHSQALFVLHGWQGRFCTEVPEPEMPLVEIQIGDEPQHQAYRGRESKADTTNQKVKNGKLSGQKSPKFGRKPLGL